MSQLRAALQALPDDHAAKLGFETWPCGSHKVTALTFVNAPRNLRSKSFFHLSFLSSPDFPSHFHDGDTDCPTINKVGSGRTALLAYDDSALI